MRVGLRLGLRAGLHDEDIVLDDRPLHVLRAAQPFLQQSADGRQAASERGARQRRDGQRLLYIHHSTTTKRINTLIIVRRP